jgi:N-6 DNA Methylase
MSRRRKSTDTTPFDTLRLEGSLFVPELLERAASGEATFQKETDYAIPKGLKLHDEYGRAFRIATATWQSFAQQTARADLDAAAVTRAFVVDFLRQCLGYNDLAPFGSPIQLGDRGFPVTAQALSGRLPVVIAPHNLGLDDPDPRFAIIGSGSRKKSAHQLAQEFLNASPDSLWAIVTNGRILRLLRDADTLTRPNFLEFDLETILRDDQHRYADFSALWRILHSSRAVSPDSPAACIWEQWKSEGHAQGLRVRDGLRDGVTQALLILGRGFLTQPDNTALRQRLHDGTLTTDAYFQQLLRIIYRSLFLFCAEERDLLHAPGSTPAARQAYATGYSLRRFRSRALRQSAHDPHGDLWQSLRIVFRSLSGGQPRLALPALGGLFAETQCPDLDSAALTNRDLLSAMRELRWFFDKKTGKRSAIDYRNMGPEELGSVYESLLELVPTLDLPGRVFGFAGITDTVSSSGNARKTTGSYYTPDSLVQELIKSALDPVIAQKLADHPANPIDALLSITVCDPSCGSGHFLLAAARRLAEKLAELRAPDGAVRPDDYRHALREVASRCLYGVDINPMAVELCRVALWLETVDPGKPLGFLNHHIRHGNSLLGTTPDLIAAGLPDETFTAIEGDDKPACAELKKRNKAERTGFGPLFAQEEDSIREKLRQAATSIEAMDDSQPAALQKKEAAFLNNETAPEYRHAKLLADLWCAAFVIKKTIRSNDTPVVSSSSESPIPAPVEGQLLHTDDDLFGQPVLASKTTAKPKKPLITDHRSLGTAVGITTGTLRDFVQGKPLPEDLESEVNELAEQYRIFHWHLAFPQVFAQGGFDCILGNPPWDKIQPEEEKFFFALRPDIANAPSAKIRKSLIASLPNQDSVTHKKWETYKRIVDSTCLYLRSSGILRFTCDGNLNSYRIFTEVASQLISGRGRAGLVSQTGLATDESGKELFDHLLRGGRLVRFWDFENRGEFFVDVHQQFRFCLITITGNSDSNSGKSAEFGWLLHKIEETEAPDRLVHLSASDLLLFNPSSRTCPVLTSQKDVELSRLIYGRSVHIMLNEKDRYERIDFLGELFNMTRDSGLFLKEPPDDPLPLYEAKFIHQFDHRFASSAEGDVGDVTELEKQNPDLEITPKSFVSAEIVRDRTQKRGIHTNWLCGFRSIASPTNEHTSIAAVFPFSGVGNSINLILGLSGIQASMLIAASNSCAFDYCARQKLSGSNVNIWIFKQLPIPTPTAYSKPCPWALHPQSTIHDPPILRDWLLPRVLELTYTAWDLEAFAQDCGWPGPPFRWDEDRRFLLRCELDAAFFHLYLGSEDEWRQQPEALTRAFPTPRHAVSYIMDTFPIVKRKDEAKHGSYRTKDTILQIYDALAESITSGIAYQTLLDPVPASFRTAHPPRIPKIARSAPKEADDIWLHFVVQFLREASSEATLSLLREGWHRFADLSRYQTELSVILSEDQFTAWQHSNPVTHARSGFHEFVSDLVGSQQLAYNEASQVLSFADGTFDDIAAEPWVQTEVSLSLRLLANHPEIEKWLPRSIAQHPVQREVAMREFLTVAS